MLSDSTSDRLIGKRMKFCCKKICDTTTFWPLLSELWRFEVLCDSLNIFGTLHYFVGNFILNRLVSVRVVFEHYWVSYGHFCIIDILGKFGMTIYGIDDSLDQSRETYDIVKYTWKCIYSVLKWYNVLLSVYTCIRVMFILAKEMSQFYDKCDNSTCRKYKNVKIIPYWRNKGEI